MYQAKVSTTFRGWARRPPGSRRHAARPSPWGQVGQADGASGEACAVGPAAAVAPHRGGPWPSAPQWRSSPPWVSGCAAGPRVLGTTGGAGQSAAARAWAEPRSLCGASECHALFLGGGWQWCHVHIQGCLKWLGGPGFPGSHLRSHSAVARGAPRVPPGEVGDPGPSDACGCVELPVGKVTVKARR